ncbi:MAG TPA: helix-turn-helix domain-containing protein [Pyrodictium sp.]|nr:helix-turn-helix domain-containing protein [Pyrodictium sp.]
MSKETVCSTFEILPPTLRRRIVEIVLAEGYSGKEVAELMGVSPSAVSRYIHGSLAPSPNTLCKLYYSVDEKTRTKIAEELTLILWRFLRNVLEDAIKENIDITSILEEIADYISLQLSKLMHKK